MTTAAGGAVAALLTIFACSGGDPNHPPSLPECPPGLGVRCNGVAPAGGSQANGGGLPEGEGGGGGEDAAAEDAGAFDGNSGNINGFDGNSGNINGFDGNLGLE